MVTTASTRALSAADPPHATTTRRDESSLEANGWRFYCCSEPAMSSNERRALANALHLKPFVHLPEMVFAGNITTLEHAPTGLVIRFRADDALQMWAHAHADQDMHADHSSYDFTYSTDYKGSVARKADTGATQEYMPVAGVKTSETLPLDKLRQQVQILFYGKVILFEDDVRDLGEIYMEVRIRVMGFGFLLLCRYYCRLDDKLVKVVDTRYYHEFGASFIWRDHQMREATIPGLQKLMYPTDDMQQRHLDFSADAVYQALPPSFSATEKIALEGSC